MNPMLPRQFFIPDGEAHAMPDGRLYLYGSQDIGGRQDYCSKSYRVFSTDNGALTGWQDHGVSFDNGADSLNGCPWQRNVTLYAPDAICKDGKYYLFVCGANAFEGVAQADQPAGPFRVATPIVGADGDGIDPAVFVDEDGQGYLLWGQFRLKGAKLTPDMKALVPGSTVTDILTEQQHGFHEGSSLRRRGDTYYLVYTDISRGKATCLAYATAKSPLGPYTKRGVIIDNTGCDPQSWNNHGSIESFNGQWYVFYHRSSQNGIFSRRACAEPITFLPDGSIPEVEMTSQGAEGPLNAFERIEASVACRMKGAGYIAPAQGTQVPSGEAVVGMGGGNWTQDWAEYKYLNFAGGAVSCTLRAKGKGSVSVCVADLAHPATVTVTEDWAEYTVQLPVAAVGVQPVWMLFDGKELALDWFYFNA